MLPLPDDLVFERSQARSLGWSDAALTRAVTKGKLVRLRRGLFCAVGQSGATADAVAAQRACRTSVISHGSAALLHGLPLLRAPTRPCLTVGPSGTGDVRGVHLHRATLPDQDVVLIGGLPVTSVARTLVDLARSSPGARAVVPADAALHRKLVSGDEIAGVLVRCWNWPGIGRAQRALRLTDGRAESPLESISRLVIRWLRLPTPDLQRRLGDEFGRFIGRVDFLWEVSGVVGEADGQEKYDGKPAELRAERRRQELLEDTGLIVVRWGWSDAIYRPHELRRRLTAGYVRASARDRSGLPRNWSFPVPGPSRRGENRIDTAAY